MKINHTTPEAHEYTSPLNYIDQPPKTLHYLGTLPSSRQPSVAIVGTRKPTSYGREVASRFARELAQAGVVIVSGLALGIDATAHRACLDSGGTTIAVLGNGLHRLYPVANRALGERIVHEGGAVISEYPEGTEPYPSNFLQRNRLVSGLADAVVIIEAASRSGTLNTAMHALGQGRDIFAVPGNITSPLSAGCNHLLRQGATPATSAADILEAIMPSAPTQATQAALPLGSTPLETAIINLIASGIRQGDELQKASGASASEFTSALTMLEINGHIVGLGANQWRLK